MAFVSYVLDKTKLEGKAFGAHVRNVQVINS